MQFNYKNNALIILPIVVLSLIIIIFLTNIKKVPKENQTSQIQQSLSLSKEKQNLSEAPQSSNTATVIMPSSSEKANESNPSAFSFIPSKKYIKVKTKPAYGSRISFSKIKLNSKSISLDKPIVQVGRGEYLKGKVEIKLNRLGDANSIFPIGWTASWNRNILVSLSDWVRAGTHNFSIDINLDAPSNPGRYWIIIAAGPYYDINEVFGVDHWPEHGGPRNGPLGNGNDVWDWKEEQYAQAFWGYPIICISDGQPNVPFLARAILVTVQD